MNKFFTLFLGATTVVLGALMTGQNVFASGMSIAPLEYRASLKQGESKKGFVDIVNPEASSVSVRLTVQAFRQINDQGGLQFYDDSAITNGIQLDLESIELGPGEGARVYFRLDGAKLPSGDIFAVIFASPDPSKKNVLTVPSSRVGTLLMLQNGTPSTHHAEVEHIDANWLQIDDAISARLLIKNTDSVQGSAIGFFPRVTVGLRPYVSNTVDGPLLFAGRTREVAYRQAGSYFGPLTISATIDGKTSSKLVFAITGYWRWLAPLILVMLAAILMLLLWFVKRSNYNNKKASKRP